VFFVYSKSINKVHVIAQQIRFLLQKVSDLNSFGHAMTNEILFKIITKIKFFIKVCFLVSKIVDLIVLVLIVRHSATWRIFSRNA
jgi:hypothetical protein